MFAGPACLEAQTDPLPWNTRHFWETAGDVSHSQHSGALPTRGEGDGPSEKRSVAVNGYGVIGKRVADAVARQDDMELAGVADINAEESIAKTDKALGIGLLADTLGRR